MRSILFSLFIFCASAVLAQSTSTDFFHPDLDGDGIREFATVENQADGSPNELVYRATLSSDQSSFREEFGKSSDDQAHGDYDGDGQFDLAVVREADDGTLSWRIQESSGNGVTERTFGLVGDSILAGCDFDLDGKTDPAIIRGSEFQVLLSADGETMTATLPLVEGAVPVTAHCADISGDRVPDLLLLGSNLSGAESRIQKKLCKRKKRKCKKNLLALSGTNGARFFELRVNRKTSSVFTTDLDKNGIGEVAILIQKKRKSKLEIILPGQGILKETLPVQAADATGYQDQNYNGIMFLDNSGRMFVFDPLSLALTLAVPNIEGESLLHDVNFASTGATSSADPGKTCHELLSANDGPDGFLWKLSDHGGLVVLFPTRYSRAFKSVQVQSAGNIEGSLYYTGFANGNRQQWRHNSSPGSFSDNSLVVATSSSGKKTCYQIGDSSKRND